VVLLLVSLYLAAHTAELFFFSVVLAGLLSLVLTLNLYAFRASLRRQGAGLSATGVLASLVPSGEGTSERAARRAPLERRDDCDQ
jgi:hypothetical protein